MDDDGFFSGSVFGFFIGALIAWAITFLVLSGGYDRGYCAAIGGEKITDGICNVDGKVVEVK